jgi:hypothetical protein
MKSIMRFLFGLAMLGIGGYEAIKALQARDANADSMAEGFIALALILFGLFLIVGPSKQRQEPPIH